jgi:predicted ATP-dependent serine protease
VRWLDEDDPEVQAAREKYEQSEQKGETKNERGANGHDTANTRIAFKRGSDVTMQKVDWLWRGWLARGKLHVLGGQKGAGKSTIAFDLLAQMTCGGKFPDGSAAPLVDVLVWSGEDDIQDTILPRMVVAGADRDRIYRWRRR